MEFDFDIYVKQLIPPSWRDTWREQLMVAVLAPWRAQYEKLYAYQAEIKKSLNLNAQKLVLRDYLNEQCGYEFRQIYFTENRGEGKYTIHTPADDNKETIIQNIMKDVLIAGTDYNIETYKTWQ